MKRARHAVVDDFHELLPIFGREGNSGLPADEFVDLLACFVYFFSPLKRTRDDRAITASAALSISRSCASRTRVTDAPMPGPSRHESGVLPSGASLAFGETLESISLHLTLVHDANFWFRIDRLDPCALADQARQHTSAKRDNPHPKPLLKSGYPLRLLPEPEPRKTAILHTRPPRRSEPPTPTPDRPSSSQAARATAPCTTAYRSGFVPSSASNAGLNTAHDASSRPQKQNSSRLRAALPTPVVRTRRACLAPPCACT